MVYKAPVLKELLEWAEAQDGEAITEARMIAACSRRLSEEQGLNVNAQIWGFLSMCLRSTAETMFKRADWNNGVEGWRRLVRQIDHGKAIRLETLRRQVQELHTRPIKSLDYVRAGGVQAPDVQLKADLLRILPRELRGLLIWHATDMDVSCARFRDTVVAQDGHGHHEPWRRQVHQCSGWACPWRGTGRGRLQPRRARRVGAGAPGRVQTIQWQQ